MGIQFVNWRSERERDHSCRIYDDLFFIGAIDIYFENLDTSEIKNKLRYNEVSGTYGSDRDQDSNMNGGHSYGRGHENNRDYFGGRSIGKGQDDDESMSGDQLFEGHEDSKQVEKSITWKSR